ncbi:unnamed protein product [Dicrocoelium dendriticum]|nr:unnamed protein product [Dicrocoelium dendriticum]
MFHFLADLNAMHAVDARLCVRLLTFMIFTNCEQTLPTFTIGGFFIVWSNVAPSNHSLLSSKLLNILPRETGHFLTNPNELPSLLL